MRPGLTLLLLAVLPVLVARNHPRTVAAAVSSDGHVEEFDGRKKKKKRAKKEKKPTSKLTIDVDDLEDRIQPAAPLEVPRSRDAACSVGSARLESSELVTSKGTCTLRAAIEMAAGLSGGDSMTVLRLKSGRYRLAAPLPEVTGNLYIFGAEGRRGKKKKMPPITLGKAEERRKAQLAFDEADITDPHYEVLAAGQTGPIGTTLDGDEQHQILRASRGSTLRLERLRLEDGRAVAEGSDDPRGAMGGAVDARGLNKTPPRLLRPLYSYNPSAAPLQPLTGPVLPVYSPSTAPLQPPYTPLHPLHPLIFPL